LNYHEEVAVMKYVLILLMGVLLFPCIGCSPKVVSTGQEGVSQQSQAPGSQDADAKRRAGISEEDLTPEKERLRRLREEEQRRLAKSELFKDILFEYDSYSIKSEDLGRLKKLGTWLGQNKSVKITVEGHCDERGTKEYNLALGQKRADAVKDYLTKFGIGDNRVSAVSYGKEAPVSTGHGEDAWAANRRAHINVDEKR
jgi:peptidoglycan-associated lipoprotein